ncbi:actin cytoskeleton-regulatory complex protein PAN1-like, partial [Pollicipes pollicipes]|uniref:actin cytoskeleton-regulatory complex protein PAN1-like n=1 Tax=Pollicipes pollicipes TaxID=41117 RepID=UPI001884C197
QAAQTAQAAPQGGQLVPAPQQTEYGPPAASSLIGAQGTGQTAPQGGQVTGAVDTAPQQSGGYGPPAGNSIVSEGELSPTDAQQQVSFESVLSGGDQPAPEILSFEDVLSGNDVGSSFAGQPSSFGANFGTGQEGAIVQQGQPVSFEDIFSGGQTGGEAGQEQAEPQSYGSDDQTQASAGTVTGGATYGEPQSLGQSEVDGGQDGSGQQSAAQNAGEVGPLNNVPENNGYAAPEGQLQGGQSQASAEEETAGAPQAAAGAISAGAQGGSQGVLGVVPQPTEYLPPPTEAALPDIDVRTSLPQVVQAQIDEAIRNAFVTDNSLSEEVPAIEPSLLMDPSPTVLTITIPDPPVATETVTPTAASSGETAVAPPAPQFDGQAVFGDRLRPPTEEYLPPTRGRHGGAASGASRATDAVGPATSPPDTALDSTSTVAPDTRPPETAPAPPASPSRSEAPSYQPSAPGPQSAALLSSVGDGRSGGAADTSRGVSGWGWPDFSDEALANTFMDVMEKTRKKLDTAEEAAPSDGEAVSHEMVSVSDPDVFVSRNTSADLMIKGMQQHEVHDLEQKSMLETVGGLWARVL